MNKLNEAIELIDEVISYLDYGEDVLNKLNRAKTLLREELSEMIRLSLENKGVERDE